MKKRGEIFERDIDGMEVQADPFLSHCAAAIREKRSFPGPEETTAGFDLVEQESQWLVKYTDVQKLTGSSIITEDELVRFLRHLKKLIPLEALAKAEERGDKKKRSRGKRIIKRLRNRYSFSRDALAFYTALYSAWQRDISL